MGFCWLADDVIWEFVVVRDGRVCGVFFFVGVEGESGTRRRRGPEFVEDSKVQRGNSCFDKDDDDVVVF
jgi:hypothetical protein